MKTSHVLLGLVVLLIAAAFFLPSNSLTGHIVNEKSCGELGCTQLCDVPADGSADAGDNDGLASTTTCAKGMLCCPTHWDTGVCEYEMNCERVREYSLYQKLETYQDSVLEQPSQVTFDVRSFLIPLIATIGIIAYAVYQWKQGP